MLARKYRLKGDREFKKILGRGKYISGSFVTIKYFFNVANKYPKIGIIISKKVSGKATDRNRLKRQISEIIYKFIDNLPTSIEIIIISKKIPDSFEILEKEIITMFKKGQIKLE